MTDHFDTPKHSDLVYDVGMHKGEDSEFYLRKGFRVIAFEANPDLVQHCRVRLKEYIDQERLIIVEGAIVAVDSGSSGKKTVSFYKYDGMSFWGTVCPNWDERNAKMGNVATVIEIEAVDFTQVLQTYGIPHYLKIDIEGCDMICTDALKLFRQRPSYISIEAEKSSMKQINGEIEMMQELGYDGFKAVEQSTIATSQIPPRSPVEGKYVAHEFEEGASGLFGSELGGEWKTKDKILQEYRIIVLVYNVWERIVSQWTFSRIAKTTPFILPFLQAVYRRYHP